jgi:hypothetical protein
VETVVRTVEGDSESFSVKVGLHQGSVLSPLLFIIDMHSVTRALKERLPWELLYVYDLELVATSERELKEKKQKWKISMESKGLKTNAGKTKVMVGGEGLGKVEVTCKTPFGVCGKGVGMNSLQCTSCENWILKRRSGVKGSLQKASASFECRMCIKERPQVTNIAKQNVIWLMVLSWKMLESSVTWVTCSRWCIISSGH